MNSSADTGQTVLGMVVLLFPILLSLIALAAGLAGYRRSKALPSGRGKTASIVGIALGAFSTAMWITVFALLALSS